MITAQNLYTIPETAESKLAKQIPCIIQIKCGHEHKDNPNYILPDISDFYKSILKFLSHTFRSGTIKNHEKLSNTFLYEELGP